ncbi:hypothetical protein HC928_09950, partial [bacterium]|nr:hypothetical protein [bacterium]
SRPTRLNRRDPVGSGGAMAHQEVVRERGIIHFQGSLHPDLNHPQPIGPHWDYKDTTGKQWRIFPDGRCEPK